MNENFNYITKVKIEGLWGFDDLNLVWELNRDVNVLAGPNGSGKSTVLKLVAALSNHKLKIREFLSPTLFFKVEVDYDGLVRTMESSKYAISYYEDENKGITNIKNCNYIDSFDKFIPQENIQKTTREGNIKTLLDLELFWLEQDYKNYLLDNSKAAFEILNNKVSTIQHKEEAITHLNHKKNLFLKTIDQLFAPTYKKIDREANNIQFILREEKIILPHQLSSGEKQMLIILLSTLIQNNQPAIMIMDEPEVSLHTDWQESLIQNIRSLNENVQIIIATHSPFIISQGWGDKVFQMEDLLISTKYDKANR